MRQCTAAQRATRLFWGVVGSGVLVVSSVTLVWLFGSRSTPPMTILAACVTMMQQVWGFTSQPVTSPAFAGFILLGLVASAAWAGGRGLRAWWRTRRLLARSAPYSPGRWPTLDAALATLPYAQQRLRTLSTAPLVACTVGLWRPQIVLSTGLIAALSPPELGAVLGHEWGHVHHRDPLRRALLQFCSDLGWFVPIVRVLAQDSARVMEDAADDMAVALTRQPLDLAAALVKAAHGEEPPLVVDPFAGGGSIPLEALRVGCEAFASDLNPVACLILKVMLEDIPRHGPELAEDLRRVGAEIKRKAEKELADLYPKDPDGAMPIAYLWARTVRCEQPGCGAEIPLMRSFWLSKKANRKRALRYKVIKKGGAGVSPATVAPSLEFEIFEPKMDKEVPGGTVTRAKATCLCCNMVLSPDRVRAQLAAQRGGADVIFDERQSGTGFQPVRMGGARLLAVVTLKPGEQGRFYRLPTARDYEAVWKATKALEKKVAQASGLSESDTGETPVPHLSLDGAAAR